MNILISEIKQIPINVSNRKCLVLLSTYNGEKYIREQIDSLIEQKGIQLDILIRDDGSRDKTVEIIEMIQSKYKNSIRLYKGKNIGIHNSFAQLIELAPDGYDFYLFSDQDDVWDNNKVYVATELMNINQVPFYWGCARLVDDRGISINNTSTSNAGIFKFYMNSKHKIMTPGVQGCTMVVSQEMFNVIKKAGYPKKYGHDTWIPIVANYLYGGVYDSVPRMNYRQHDSSWTGNRKKKFNQIRVELKYFFSGLSRYSQLAEDILKRFGDQLTEEERGYLIGLAYKGGFFSRTKNIIKYRYAKEQKIKTICFWCYYLLV